MQAAPAPQSLYEALHAHIPIHAIRTAPGECVVTYPQLASALYQPIALAQRNRYQLAHGLAMLYEGCNQLGKVIRT